MSRFDHAFWIALLVSGCVPTDDGSKPAPEGTASPQAVPRPVSTTTPRLQLPERTATPMRPAPTAAAGDAAARMPVSPAARMRPALPGQPAARPMPGPPPGPAAAAAAPAAAAKADDAAPDAPIKAVFVDYFERAELGPSYNATKPAWRIEAGKLCGRGAKNHPVWLRRKLPTNARIELDAMSTSPDGDLKVEVWGDGKSFAKGNSYTDATSYLAIFGGWKNSYHVLARIDEHAKDRPEVKIDPSGTNLKAAKVMPNRWYHFKIERNDGKTVRWYVDDIEVLSFADPNPLKGEGHEHLGFNDWEIPVCFDNLKITPLGG